MVVLLGLSAFATPPRLLPDRYASSVETPFGHLHKGTLYGLCFSRMTRVGTVVHVNTFLKELKDRTGEVYSKRPYTTLTLTTDATLRGPDAETFELIVEGGTIGRTHFPTPPGAPVPVVGHRYVVGYNTVLPPEHQVAPNWPENTAVIQAAVKLNRAASVDPASARTVLESTCASTDFSSP